MPHRQFALPELAACLLPHAFDPDAGRDDGAHDLGHLLRVWRNASRIMAVEGGDPRLLTAATILHDCVHVEKNAAGRNRASLAAAERATDLLHSLGWSAADCAAVHHAIAAHSFSAGIAPNSLEAKILQDADRLDAIGLIGVARCFYIAGRMGSAIHHPEDPQAKARALQDDRFALDHFSVKLLKLAENFRTPTGRELAAKRHAALQDYRTGLIAEIG